MRLLNNNKLFAMCGGFAALSIGMACYAVRKQINVYRDSTFFSDALSILESHPGATKILGTPVTGSQVNIIPSKSKEPSSIAEFSAFVKGPRSSGTMFFWAERKLDQGETVKIDITRIEFQPKNEKLKRLVVKS